MRGKQSGVSSDAMLGPYGSATGAITLEDTTETTRVTQHRCRGCVHAVQCSVYGIWYRVSGVKCWAALIIVCFISRDLAPDRRPQSFSLVICGCTVNCRLGELVRIEVRPSLPGYGAIRSRPMSSVVCTRYHVRYRILYHIPINQYDAIQYTTGPEKIAWL